MQSSDPDYSQLSFADERFGEMIDMEYDSRINHTIEKISETLNLMILQRT